MVPGMQSSMGVVVLVAMIVGMMSVFLSGLICRHVHELNVGQG